MTTYTKSDTTTAATATNSTTCPLNIDFAISASVLSQQIQNFLSQHLYYAD